MTEETIVAVYDTVAHADAAVRDLEAANVPSSSISRHARETSVETSSTTASAQPQGFWSRMLGGEPDYDPAVYDRSIEAGSVVVAVRISEEHATRVMDVLEKHNPVDLEERASSYGLAQAATTRTAPTGTVAPTRATAATGDETIQLSEETLSVGKRAVSRGTTRVRRFVVETPVEQQVNLRDETVSVQRRPVTEGRRVEAGDFTDKVIEMTETGEEAVVSKTARVTEEVVVSKAATERVETVRDTVRRQDVEVEQVPGTTRTGETKPVLPTAPRDSKI